MLDVSPSSMIGLNAVRVVSAFCRRFPFPLLSCRGFIFPQPGLPSGSYSLEENWVRVPWDSGSLGTGARVSPLQ